MHRTAPSGSAILLVDDDALVRASIARLLASAEYRVVVAGEPLEALRLAARHADEIRLAILDVMMPEMTGPELAAKLLDMGLATKVLFVSGYVTEEMLVDIRTITADTPLIKPFSVDDLLSRVHTLLEVERE